MFLTEGLWLGAEASAETASIHVPGVSAARRACRRSWSSFGPSSCLPVRPCACLSFLEAAVSDDASLGRRLVPGCVGLSARPCVLPWRPLHSGFSHAGPVPQSGEGDEARRASDPRFRTGTDTRAFSLRFTGGSLRAMACARRGRHRPRRDQTTPSWRRSSDSTAVAARRARPGTADRP